MHPLRIVAAAAAAQRTEALPHAVAVRRAISAAAATVRRPARLAHRTASCAYATTGGASSGSGNRGSPAVRSGIASATPSATSASTSAAAATPSAASALSLSDLALAFQQLSHDHLIGADTSQPPRTADSPSTELGSDSSAAPAATPPAREPRRSPAHRADLQELPKPAATRPLRAPRDATLALSPHYANTVRGLSDAQLRVELEHQVWRLSYSDVMQCMMEITERLTPAASRRACGPRGGGGGGKQQAVDSMTGAAGGGDVRVADSPAATPLMADHGCLIAFINALHRVDVYALETELDGRGRARATASAPAAAAATPPSERFGHVLLRWLSCEVSRIDARTALLVLHFLAQQQLVHGEAVLETLADTIAVHLDRSTAAQGHGADGSAGEDASRTAPFEKLNSSNSSSSSSDNGAPFTLANYAHLLDTMARYQAQLTRLAVSVSTRSVAARPDTDGPPHSVDAYSSSNNNNWGVPGDTGVSVDTAAPEPLDRQRHTTRGAAVHHPIVNARFFHHIAEALTHALQPRPPPSPSSSPTPASAPLLAMQSADFLFLVRALSKLAWWHGGLVAALTPQLAQHLRSHPNAVLVVAALVGRRENATGDAVLMRVMQESMSTLLQRRLRVATSASAGAREGRGADGVGGVGDGGASDGDVDVDAYDVDDVGLSGAVEEAEAEEVEAAEGRRWGRASRGGAGEAGAGRRSPATPPSAASAPRVAASATPSPAPRGGSVALVDVHALAGLVEALCRYHLRSLPQCRGTAQAELIAGMQAMLQLLLDDAQRGVHSVDAAARLLAPAPFARLLRTLLSSTAALRQAWVESGAQSAAAATASTRAVDCTRHPLLIELAYAWTAQVSSWRPPPPPPTSPHAARTPAAAAAYHRAARSVQWRRAVAVHTALIEAGLLCRGGDRSSGGGGGAGGPGAPPRLGARFFMPDNVLAAAPRVRAVVDLRKHQLNAARAADAPHDEDAAKAAAAAAPSPGRERPRYASAALCGESDGGAPVTERRGSGRGGQRHRAAAATVRPARTSDVFAKYTKALARLGC